MRRTTPVASALVILVVFLTTTAFAAAGDLDTTFDGDGKLATDFTAGDDLAAAIAIQVDGKIIVAGTTSQRFALARYDADGSLDATFGGDGRVTTRFVRGRQLVNGLAIQPDGTIVAVGLLRPTGEDSRWALARYNSDGSLDTSFSGDGKLTIDLTMKDDYAEDVALQDDGKIVVAGGAGGAGERFGLARFETNGDLDTTFGGDGTVITNFDTGFDYATAVAVLGDGKIVAAGWAGPATSNDYGFAIARFDSAGVLDPAFGGDGKVTTNFTKGNDYAWDMGVQADGKLVLVGTAAGAGGRFALARYDDTGALDATFGGDGKVITNLAAGSDVATGVAVLGDGSVVAGGWSGSVTVVPWFGPAASDDFRFAVARYDPMGVLDPTFGVDGTVTTDFTKGSDYAWDIGVQEDGKVILVGRAGGGGGRFAIARYLMA
jgi:uncharacterized delta-60 repeat protein